MENLNYTSNEIQVLEGLDAVRLRPGMSIGTTGVKGLHHILWEIVDNAVDEAANGFANRVEIVINKDGSATVKDNGRGIPVGINKKAGIPAVQVVFTILHAGGKFGGGGYKVSGGLHGVGASVVNALSEWLEVRIFQNGKEYMQRYERGVVLHPLKEVGPTEKRGTQVTFLPDKTIFEETVYDYDILKQRLREMAFLTKDLKIVLSDDREEPAKTRTFHYEGGIKEYVEYINKTKKSLYDEVLLKMYFRYTYLVFFLQLPNLPKFVSGQLHIPVPESYNYLSFCQIAFLFLKLIRNLSLYYFKSFINVKSITYKFF